MALALIQNPDVLIFYEPTTGLDPNQLVEIRSLIKEIGKDKTVMLSTHIMQEVEAICDRVIIINKGEIVADQPINKLHTLVGSKSIITIEFNKSVNRQDLLMLENVVEVQETGNNTFEISSDSIFDLRPLLFNFAVKNELTVLQLHLEEQKLEDVFHNLTK